MEGSTSYHTTMAEKDYTPQLERIIELLEQGARPLPAAPSGRPAHSGHKGGDFIKEVRAEHTRRFANTPLDWKAVNGWLTTVYGIAVRARKSAPEAGAGDFLWLHETLKTSLDNGFAQLLADIESER